MHPVLARLKSVSVPMARPDKLPRVLTDAETSSLLEQPNQRYYGPHRDYLYMRVMLKAGLRTSQTVSLRPGTWVS